MFLYLYLQNDTEGVRAIKRSIFVICLHVITFKGNSPYRFADESLDSGYKALINGNITQHLKINNLLKYLDTNLLILINACLRFEENQRINMKQIIQSRWLSSYYVIYKQRIEKKSAKQLLRKKISTIS